ncbi:hypothetical protein OEZ86_009082 [Tetradesmus obliquus]|nr:hypothetical protein OEZ86_009082 [Tetradesmus obliquus]
MRPHLKPGCCCHWPLVLSPQVGSWPAIGTWYIQLILMAQQTGMFTGSALLPIRPLRYPRTTLLTAALAYMAVFTTAFMMALKLRAVPVDFVPLCYALTTCQGYISASVFCCAPVGLVAKDAKLVQRLLVMTCAVAYIVGLVISWLWVLVH